ncbi:hypothetical protein B9Z19DRAFT_1091699 [Tuber borchii]|uniref:Secreted protein n=1 Tax=Tuber borchii TaxID=42251 RepID=A0A2T6ZHC6_TUBBO|nr:hypothetical protein B9Z19DRAFT_1091699 [Tuber borchii]
MMRGTLRDACLSFLLAWESAKGERGYGWKSVDMYWDRWKDGGRFCCAYICSSPLQAVRPRSPAIPYCLAVRNRWMRLRTKLPSGVFTNKVQKLEEKR